MVKKSNSLKKYCDVIKISLLFLISFTSIVGCRYDGEILKPEALGPLFEARNNVMSGAIALKKLNLPLDEKEDSNGGRKKGRQLYDAAADSLNALIDETILAVNARARVTDTPDFKNRLDKALKATDDFEKFLSKERDNYPERGRPQPIPFPIPLVNLDVPQLINAINTAVSAARDADVKQRDKIGSMLKDLKLESFDDVGETNQIPKPSSSPTSPPPSPSLIPQPTATP